MTLRATDPQPSDEETLILGRFLLAVNALDAAMENAIVRFWKVSDQRFCRVFVDGKTTGSTLGLLRKSPYREPWFKADCELIQSIVEHRNAVAHKPPRQDFDTPEVDPHTTEDDYWEKRDVSEFMLYDVGKREVRITDIDEMTVTVREVTARIRRLRDRDTPGTL